jgi:beta,beta-carotene 9',10'-dioxygenase
LVKLPNHNICFLCRIAVPEFGTLPNRGVLGRLWGLLTEKDEYENANVNVALVGNRYVAMTEVPRFIEFSPQNLNTLGHVRSPMTYITSIFFKYD